MKSFFTCIVILYSLRLYPVSYLQEKFPSKLAVARNIVIITTDGFRWQEVFTGADSNLINNEKYTPCSKLLNQWYWSNDRGERRKKLMPFFWNIIGSEGQLYGNRNFGNKVNNANPYSLSYPGYNEIFTGIVDPRISSNRKTKNPNLNVLAYLESKPAFNDQVVAFTSWNVFPLILNSGENGLLVNCGYQSIQGDINEMEKRINDVQHVCSEEEEATRNDQLTFIAAKEYMRRKRPRVTFIGFGETDEFAHQGRYDLYLQQANKVDQMIGELWTWIQTTPGYKDDTYLVITTDHGRGRGSRWTKHGEFITGSSDTWMALLGPGIPPDGEIRHPGQLYQAQIAKTIAELLGEEFLLNNDVAQPPIALSY